MDIPLYLYYYHPNNVLLANKYSLFEIGFFSTQNPSRMMQRLRRLYARTSLEQEELNILRGILSMTTEYNARLKSRFQEEQDHVQKH